MPAAPDPFLSAATGVASAIEATPAGTSAVCNAGALTVLYDGACPLCRREIAVYRDLPTADPIQFVDISRGALPSTLPASLSREDLLRRFHVQRADGSVASGARGFIALWAALPGWRWLARLGALPGVAPLMETAYRGFLRARPAMQRTAAAFEPPSLHVPDFMVAELRSDHAGETGAIWIYRGVLAFTRDDGVRDFARRHLATETEHLRLVEPLLPWPQRSRLLLPWRIAGFMTGALPALFGPRAVYGTIAAVETFVDTHYQQQIDRLAGLPEAEPLRNLLVQCQADECHHRDEATALRGAAPGPLLRAWCALVGAGSAAAVVVARRV